MFDSNDSHLNWFEGLQELLCIFLFRLGIYTYIHIKIQLFKKLKLSRYVWLKIDQANEQTDCGRS